MFELTNNEQLRNIRGGGISIGIVAAIASGVIFLIGLIDGYTRPLKCRRV